MMEVCEIMELIRKEIEEINSMKTVVYANEKGFERFDMFDDEIVQDDYFVDHLELARKHQEERRIDLATEVRSSPAASIYVDKILGYNALIDNISHKKTNEYYKYFNTIHEQIKQNKEAMDVLMTGKNIFIELTFHVNNIQKDLDNVAYNMESLFDIEDFELYGCNFKKNVIKGVIDSITKTGKVNDSKIVDLLVRKRYTYLGEQEKINYKIYTLPDHLSSFDPLEKEINERGLTFSYTNVSL